MHYVCEQCVIRLSSISAKQLRISIIKPMRSDFFFFFLERYSIIVYLSGEWQPNERKIRKKIFSERFRLKNHFDANKI